MWWPGLLIACIALGAALSLFLFNQKQRRDFLAPMIPDRWRE